MSTASLAGGLRAVVSALVLAAGILLPPGAGAQDAGSNPELLRTTVLRSEEELVRATAIIIFEPEVRSAPVVQEPEALAAIIPHAVERPTRIERLPDNSWRIITTLLGEDLLPKAKLTVIGFTASGKSVVSPVQWLQANEQIQNYSQLAEVRCEQQELGAPFKNLLQRSPQELEKLVDIRKKRRRLLEELLRERLTPAVLSRLTTFEAQLAERNSAQPRPSLSPELPLDELIERLIVLQTYREGEAIEQSQ